MTYKKPNSRWLLGAGLGSAAVIAIASIAMAASGQSPTTDAATAAVTTVTASIDPQPVTASSDLTEAEVSDILFMREEEKLAHDVYLTLEDIWSTQILSNIARSEQTHMDAVYGLIESYDLTDPVSDNAVGVFVDPDLQSMYDDLIEKGSTSLTDALEVGAIIEEVDIEDLVAAIEETSTTDLADVWNRLLSGSQNHLRAFTSQLETLGATYTPSILDPDRYAEILASAGSRAQGASGTDLRGPGRAGRG